MGYGLVVTFEVNCIMNRNCGWWVGFISPGYYFRTRFYIIGHIIHTIVGALTGAGADSLGSLYKIVWLATTLSKLMVSWQ